MMFPKPPKRTKKTPAQRVLEQAQGKRHKYRAEKDGEFPSKLEGSVWQILKLREKAGEISNLRRQASVRLKEKCPTCGDGPVVWKVDFSATLCVSGASLFIEAKGAETSDFKKRKRLWKTAGPGILEIWKGSWRNPQLVEVIEPKEIQPCP